MWLIVSITSYFINAGVHVADKFLLSKKIHSSIVYAFYVGIWSIFNFTLLIFDPWTPTFREFSIDILAGLVFLITLIFWYKALHQSEATRAVPIVGALVPIFSLLFGYIFLDEVLEQKQILAFLILIVGGVLISVKNTRFYSLNEFSNRLKNIFGNLLGGIHASYRPTQRLLVNSVFSALLFAAYYVIVKYIYISQPFIGGFVWSRLGTFLGVIIIFLIPQYRKMIIDYRDHARKPKSFIFFISVRLFAALAFIMLNWAISLGSVAMVNALQGTQYVFLFLIILFLSIKYPHILKEESGRGVILQKTIGMVLVILGLYILVV